MSDWLEVVLVMQTDYSAADAGVNSCKNHSLVECRWNVCFKMVGTMTETEKNSEPTRALVDPASTTYTQEQSWFSRRWPIILVCAASVVWCLAYGILRGQFSNDWVRNNGGGVPYTVFWILLVAIFWPSKRLVLRICIFVVLAVCGLEFFQLYDAEPLASFRRTRFGAALLGSTFVWNDIPPYFIGGLVGWTVLRGLAICCNGCNTEPFDQDSI